MASNIFKLETAKQFLEDGGFFEIQDYEIGERISTFESKGCPYGTLFALELLMEPLVCNSVSVLPIFPFGDLIG